MPKTKPRGRAGRRRYALRRQRGLTLIEILVTLVLLSILVLGLTGLWSAVSGHFLSLTLRQKAVFVLSGETARLSALYRFTDFADDAADSDNSGAPSDEQYSSPTQRKIYPQTSSNAPVVNDIVTQVATDFDCGDSACGALVFYDPNSGGSGDDRVYVWVDQARKITGRLSWHVAAPEAVTKFQDCSDGVSTGDGVDPGGRAPCQELTVFLEFPFRFVDGTTPNAATGFDRTHQLSLKTIVGRR